MPADDDQTLDRYRGGLEALARAVSRARWLIPGHGTYDCRTRRRPDADRRYLDAIAAGGTIDDPGSPCLEWPSCTRRTCDGSGGLARFDNVGPLAYAGGGAAASGGPMQFDDSNLDTSQLEDRRGRWRRHGRDGGPAPAARASSASSSRSSTCSWAATRRPSCVGTDGTTTTSGSSLQTTQDIAATPKQDPAGHHEQRRPLRAGRPSTRRTRSGSSRTCRATRIPNSSTTRGRRRAAAARPRPTPGRSTAPRTRRCTST